MFLIPILLLSFARISDEKNSECAGERSELYTLVDHTKHFLLMEEETFFEAFGPDAGSIEEAFLATDPLCRNKGLSLAQRAPRGDKRTMAEFESTSRGDAFISPDANTVFFFCTVPSSEPFDHMVHIPPAIDYSKFYYLVPIFALLLFMSATFSGLNLAIMSFSVADLKLIIQSDQHQINRNRATRVLRLREQSNFVLCTVIIGNCFCNTSITLIINFIGTSFGIGHLFVTELVSTSLLLIFTEILPSLICTKHALKFASSMEYFVIFTMVLTLPVSWPLSRLLDFLLGGDEIENEMLLSLEALEETGYSGNKDFREMMNVVKKTLMLRQKRAEDVMTPIERVTMISDRKVLGEDFLQKYHDKGHSRLPVYEGRNKNRVCGVLNVKDLMLLLDDDRGTDLTAGTLLSVLEKRRKHCFVLNTMPVQQFMKELQEGCAMAIVIRFIGFRDDIDYPGDGFEVVGIITLEDSLEEIVGEIFDEKDRQELLDEEEQEALDARRPTNLESPSPSSSDY